MFDVASILKPIVIKITEYLLSQNRKTDWFPRVVVKLDGLDIEGIFICVVIAILI